MATRPFVLLHGSELRWHNPVHVPSRRASASGLEFSARDLGYPGRRSGCARARRDRGHRGTAFGVCSKRPRGGNNRGGRSRRRRALTVSKARARVRVDRRLRPSGSGPPCSRKGGRCPRPGIRLRAISHRGRLDQAAHQRSTSPRSCARGVFEAADKAQVAAAARMAC